MTYKLYINTELNEEGMMSYELFRGETLIARGTAYEENIKTMFIDRYSPETVWKILKI